MAGTVLIRLLFWKKKKRSEKREGVSVFAEFTPFSIERVGIKQCKLTIIKNLPVLNLKTSFYYGNTVPLLQNSVFAQETL